ncbi:MAG: NDP-sugar synthase [Bradymonadaceae bacterium]|nr:NDP-sugar synthase [Lujinxingiaceae bacterium]
MPARAVIGAVLCAGFGSRLRPLTDVLPKPLLPFLNTPLIAYALNHLSLAGVERVGINLHHLPDTIPPVVDRLCEQFGLLPVYVREWEILGTAGGIRGIWQGLGDPQSTLVALNGDSVMNLDLNAHLEAHRQSGAEATIVVRPRASDQPGRVWLDREGNLQGLRAMRHPDAPPDEELVEYDFTGVHILEPRLLETIPLEKGCMVGDVYGPMLEAGKRVNICVSESFWAALDTPELFVQTSKRVLLSPEIFEQAPLPDPTSAGLYIFNPDTIDNKAQLAAPILCGLHVKIEAGAKLGPFSLIDGVELAGNASVKNAVLYGMGRIEGEWHDCLAVAGKVIALK